jgi:hypothetical protein
MLYSDLPSIHIMRYVPYVGFVTYRRATVKISLYFKRLMFMQIFCIKKKTGPHRFPRSHTKKEETT